MDRLQWGFTLIFTIIMGSGLLGQGTPGQFQFNQSSEQAFYFIVSATNLFGEDIEEGDWIGVFNDRVCVGAREWVGPYTDIPVMGDEGEPWTEGYMQNGEFPSFVIYDASEDDYSTATPGASYPWYPLMVVNVPNIDAEIVYHLHEGNQLVSFYNLPDDNSLTGVFDQLEDKIFAVLGEGVVSQLLPTGNWVGSLETIDRDNGYWIIMNDGNELWLDGGYTDRDLEYDLHYGSNLVSYPYVEAGYPDDIISDSENFNGIIGQGVATAYIDGQWVGSLNALKPKSGYWFKVINDAVFQYNPPAEYTAFPDSLYRNPGAMTYHSYIQNYELPEMLAFEQSNSQAFYFVADIEGIELEKGDILVALHNDNVVGARYWNWNGSYTDIPVMGKSDLISGTIDYLSVGETPELYALKANGEWIELTGNIQPYAENEIFTLSSLTGVENAVAAEYSLLGAYPNPFNPTTNISFDLSAEGMVQLQVFDMTGRQVADLVSANKEPGVHSVTWDAGDQSSGIYLVKMMTAGEVFTQKLMLLK